MKLLGGNKSKITKMKTKITDVVFIHCNFVNNNYQRNLRILYTFVPNKSFGQLLDISTKNFVFLKPFNSEY